MKTEYDAHLDESVQYIKSGIRTSPSVGIILGSGLGDFGDLLVDRVSIDTKEVPHYPVSSVIGHAGRLLFGRIQHGTAKSSELMVFQGRVHFYESNDIDIVVYPVEVAHRMGIRKMIVTNAAGGVNRQFAPGDLMFITDYLNLAFENPLMHRPTSGTASLQPGFSPQLLEKAKSIATKNNIPYREGVYCWNKGPSYESAAEIRMMGKMGADAVGMSTVPEVLLAARYGIEMLGISCITNLATGLTSEKLNHAEVTEVANKVKHNFVELLSTIALEL